MSKEKAPLKGKSFFLLDSSELSQWLESNGFNQETIEIFSNNSITGYDLCSFSEDDIKQLNIPIAHEYFLLLKKIQEVIFDELKIQVVHEGKTFTFELENDPSYSIESLSQTIVDLIGLKGKIYFKTENNEILLPNVRIVQRLITHPKKYSKLTVVNSNDISSSKYDKGYSSIGGGYSLYKKESPADTISSIPKVSNTTNLEGDYNSKKVNDLYSYQPLINQDGGYNSIQANQLQDNDQDKNEGVGYSAQVQGIGSYQSYMAASNTNEKEKETPYSFNAKDFNEKNTLDNDINDNKKIEPVDYIKKDMKTKKDTSSANKSNDDIDNYKKMYGNYSNNEFNIEDNNGDTHQLLQDKDDYKKFASEKRNYRVNNPSTSENKLDDYQPKQYEKYSMGNYSTVDKFTRFATRQPNPPLQSANTTFQKDNNDMEGGYSSYQSKGNVNSSKDMSGNTGNNNNEGGYSSTYDLKNKVNSLRSQISNYTRDSKGLNEAPQLQEPSQGNYADYKLNKGKYQKPSSSSQSGSAQNKYV